MADKYKLIRKIGKGSYGSAYLALSRLDPSQQVVIKRVSLRGLTAKDVEDSLKEAQVLKLLDHPCIIKHIEHFKDEGYLCIVTELAGDGDLQSKVKSAKNSGKLFREETIWQWFIQMCCAVKHVHDRKILHRDIKTANIFLSLEKDGEDPMIKLGDFGISKILENTVDCAKTAVGTPYYMSPELCESKPYNYKSDIWALGCVLYEIATLKQPFDAANFNSLCIKILRGKYSPLPEIYSADLKQIVGLLLERDPEKRPDINFLLSIRPVRNRLATFSKLQPIILQNEFSHTALHGFNTKLALNYANVKGHPVQAEMKIPKVNIFSAKQAAPTAAPTVIPQSGIYRSAVVIDHAMSPPPLPRSPLTANNQNLNSPQPPPPTTPRSNINPSLAIPTMQPLISPRIPPTSSTSGLDAILPYKGPPPYANLKSPRAPVELNKEEAPKEVLPKASPRVSNSRQGESFPAEFGNPATVQVPPFGKKEIVPSNQIIAKTPCVPAPFQQGPPACGIPKASYVDKVQDFNPHEEDKIIWNGQTLRLPGIGARDSRMCLIESLRVFLESKLGAEAFLHAYRLMESVSEDDDEQKLEVQLLAIVGHDKAEYLPLICQLIFCEDREDRANRAPASYEHQAEWLVDTRNSDAIESLNIQGCPILINWKCQMTGCKMTDRKYECVCDDRRPGRRLTSTSFVSDQHGGLLVL